MNSVHNTARRTGGYRLHIPRQGSGPGQREPTSAGTDVEVTAAMSSTGAGVEVEVTAASTSASDCCCCCSSIHRSSPANSSALSCHCHMDLSHHKPHQATRCQMTRLSVPSMRAGLSFVVAKMLSTTPSASAHCCQSPTTLSLRPTSSIECGCLRFFDFTDRDALLSAWPAGRLADLRPLL